MTVDVIIPTFRPDELFCLLLQRLREQTFAVHGVIILNTDRDLWEEACKLHPIRERLRELPFPHTLVHVAREKFDHGATRERGVALSDADIVLFLTQDAVPADREMVGRLIAPFLAQEGGAGNAGSGWETGGGSPAEGVAGGNASGGSPAESTASGNASGGSPAKSAAGWDADGGSSADGGAGASGSATIAVSYARQIPRPGCGEIERYTRAFNYPAEPRVKTRADIGKLGIKTYFCSDVCAAYRRDLFWELGGFESPAIFNEDMFFVAGAISRGYAVAYAAGARVIHSHDYTMGQQFRRNFDLAVSQADHPEIFAGVSSVSEGKRLVLGTMLHLIRAGKPLLIWKLFWQSAAKYAGYAVGKRYRKMGRKAILRCTANPYYWHRVWRGG